jgi:hypothetical protein
MGKDKTPCTYTTVDDKGTSTTVDVPEEHHKYIKRLFEKTDGIEKNVEIIKQFLNEYLLTYQKAMNLMAGLIEEIDGKIKSVRERRFPEQPPNEFCLEIVMLDAELEKHYSIMEPLHSVYKIIKQKDAETLESGYNSCRKRNDQFMEEVIKIMKWES